jgi:lipid A 3-O-deacylase
MGHGHSQYAKSGFRRVIVDRPIVAAWVATLVMLSALPVSAQVVDDVRIEEGNAQLDFWLPARRRPDTELTNTASVDVVTDGAPFLGQWLRLPACGGLGASQSCATTEYQIGQEMFTPSGATKVARPEPGARPYAGWLYASATLRGATSTSSEAVTVETGVTGSPSLAGQIQTAWHQLIGYPRALGWSHQIPFQPGVLIAGERSLEAARISIDGVPILSLVPRAAVSVGNVLTGAQFGAEGRLGYGVTTPWSPSVRGRGRRIQIYGIAAAREDLIAYELFLDGSTTGPALHVEKEPTVFQYEFGVGAQLGGLEVEYRAITRQREYTTGPPQHAYSILSVGIRPGW